MEKSKDGASSNPSMKAPDKRSAAWWDEFEIEREHGQQWNLGTFRLVVFRKAGEWLLAHDKAKDTETESDLWQVTPISTAPVDQPNLVRFVAAHKANTIRLVPRTADRSLVVRPHVPLYLLAGEEAEIYVSSPVWLGIIVGSRMNELCEIPVRTLSDTWFGPNTLEGEVAYALTTRARVQLSEMPMRTYRIITPITVRNEGKESLLIDRLNLPVPYLSVYTAEGGYLWTESVTLAQDPGSDLASVRVGKGAPRDAKGSRRLSQARRTSADSFLVRAFTSLFTPFQQED